MSRCPHFRRSYGNTKTFRRPIEGLSEKEIVQHILSHFILSDSHAVICRDVHTLDGLMEILRRLDDLTDLQRTQSMSQQTRRSPQRRGEERTRASRSPSPELEKKKTPIADLNLQGAARQLEPAGRCEAVSTNDTNSILISSFKPLISYKNFCNSISKFYRHPAEFISIEGDSEDEDDNNRFPCITIKVEEFALKCLIDTAAEISLIRSSSLTEEIITRRGIRINKMDLVATNQKKIGSIQQRVCLEGIIGYKTYTLNFYIFDNMQFDCIMGLDNIRKLNLTINFEEENILIQDNIVKMEEVSSEGIHQFKMVEELEEDDDDKVSRNGSIEDYEEEEVVRKIDINNEELKEKLKETLWKNRRLFNEEVTFAKDYQHIIEVEDSPLKCRNYPIPYQFKEAVETLATRLE
ncbi:hypothetical protein QE152_g25392 [Popillia japonica]|uniref:Peptidase A2 domain-containing protein n=1 Tax=Popillia japonica TaxID=7064 RepID=A0AAW1K1V8_POPJA